MALSELMGWQNQNLNLKFEIWNISSDAFGAIALVKDKIQIF